MEINLALKQLNFSFEDYNKYIFTIIKVVRRLLLF